MTFVAPLIPCLLLWTSTSIVGGIFYPSLNRFSRNTIQNAMGQHPISGALMSSLRGSQMDHCAEARCGGACSSTIGADGCFECSCSPMCPMPSCNRGCSIDYSGGPCGACPCCVCDQMEARQEETCQPVHCSPFCKIRIGLDGCLKCACESSQHLVGLYKCLVKQRQHLRTCLKEMDHTGAVSGKTHRTLCKPVYCAEFCEVVRGDNGCRKCKCDKVLNVVRFLKCRLQNKLPITSCVRYLA